MSDRRRRAIERKLARMRGANPTHAAAVAARFNAADDLYSVCPGCGHRRTGPYDDVVKPCPKCTGRT